MDMWEPYHPGDAGASAGGGREDRLRPLPRHGAHGKAVDTVRKQAHRALMAAGDETLKGTKYLWLYAERTCRSDGARSCKR